MAIRDLPSRIHPMSMPVCRMLAVFFLVLFSGPVFAQNNAVHADWSDLPVSWKTDCAPRGCLMHADVLRGDSGSPADPKDFREYVVVNVALARTTRRPESVTFYIDQ